MTSTTAPQTSLIIGRRTFAVAIIAADADEKRPLYLLTGPRGAQYTTMRNVNRPEQMFLVHARGGRGFGIPSGYERTWLTDRNGSLEVL